MFISFCGIDGSGKSSHLSYIANWLKSSNVRFKELKPIEAESPFYLSFRQIKKLYHQKHNDTFPGEYQSMILGFELYQKSKLVEDWLKDGYIVMVDRWIYSHFAYAYAHGVETEVLHRVLDFCIKPDLIFLFDISVEKALERIDRRGVRKVNETIKILIKAREKYFSIAEKNKNFIILNNEKPFKEVSSKIRRIILERIES